MDYLDSIAQLGIGVGVLLGGLYAGMQSRKSASEAKRAADNSHPISNGWGTALRQDMKRTADGVERIGEAQLLSERRELARDARLERMESALHSHLNDHKTGAAA